MKISYEPVRTILMVSAVFCLFGPLPRAVGIITTKPEHAGWVPYMDAAAWVVFAGATAYAIWAIVHNAREAMRANNPHEGPARASCAGPLDAVVGGLRDGADLDAE